MKIFPPSIPIQKFFLWIKKIKERYTQQPKDQVWTTTTTRLAYYVQPFTFIYIFPLILVFI
jgi:hypothetical protein